jgi:hypothetical protein
MCPSLAAQKRTLIRGGNAHALLPDFLLKRINRYISAT